MVYVPAAAYVWLEVAPPVIVLSPQSHVYVTIAPSGSDDDVPSTSTVIPARETVNCAVGGNQLTGCEDTFVRASLSVIVRATVYSWGAAYVCVAVTPVPVVVSPQSHAYETIVPSGSEDAKASTSRRYPVRVYVKLAD